MPIAKNVTVATRLAGEAIALPLSPLPDVQPPAIFVPKPIKTPQASRMPTINSVLPGPVNVSVSQP